MRTSLTVTFMWAVLVFFFQSLRTLRPVPSARFGKEKEGEEAPTLTSYSAGREKTSQNQSKSLQNHECKGVVCWMIMNTDANTHHEGEHWVTWTLAADQRPILDNYINHFRRKSYKIFIKHFLVEVAGPRSAFMGISPQNKMLCSQCNTSLLFLKNN